MCGAVSMEVSGEPLQCRECFCRDCRKSSGSLGHIIAVFDKNNVSIRGRSHIREYVTTKTESKHAKLKKFCGNCGSTVLFELERPEAKNLVCICPTLQDDGPLGPEYDFSKKLFPEKLEEIVNDSMARQ